jgi:hypothetical protein
MRHGKRGRRRRFSGRGIRDLNRMKKLTRLLMKSGLGEGSVVADRLPHTFAVDAEAEMVDPVGTLDSPTVEDCVKWLEPPIRSRCRLGIGPSAVGGSDPKIERNER